MASFVADVSTRPLLRCDGMLGGVQNVPGHGLEGVVKQQADCLSTGSQSQNAACTASQSRAEELGNT